MIERNELRKEREERNEQTKRGTKFGRKERNEMRKEKEEINAERKGGNKCRKKVRYEREKETLSERMRCLKNTIFLLHQTRSRKLLKIHFNFEYRVK